ncbi:alpha-(1,6)-fucosyltransferase-like [Sinocyclocheilus grahami]|uniref:alpha-(1,6)-fucosyltransferase-like n=1 Tax=Sinocyclocheilus grahami TaxID=75366 RepID=UPI0007AD5C86|nr:PREDICTED: alpha-(1,6)-fucosyltransferase-like [Sinocyclocheilus grahami]
MRPWAGSWRWIALVLLAWGTLLFYIGGHLVRDNEDVPRSSRELAKILTKLERLKQQNEDLRRMAQSLRIPEGQSDGPISSGRLRSLEEQLSRAKQKIHSFQRLSGDVGPGREQEELRRKVENGVKELWYFIHSEIQKLSHVEPSDRQKHTETLLQDLGHQQRTIMTDLQDLSQADGAGDWREKEARHLSSLVQNRISFLQNPQDCSKARKLVCNINKGCGYGCQLHHVVYCFMIAYGTQRVLILESHNWRYAPKGWETVFRPVSDTCTDRSGTTTGHWSAEDLLRVFVKGLRVSDLFNLTCPDFCPETRASHSSTRESRVHVRRTDKVGTEAAFHPIEEYMVHVEEQFQYMAQRGHVDKKRVYLATDDPSLLQEAKVKYTDYEFISDNSISWSASLHNRYTENSLRGVILDIHFLSQTDFLVCTFSSQVCRVAYEIMQTLHPDASAFFRSLDDIYYFGGQNAHNQIAIYPHQARTAEDIPLEPGDVIGVAGNHWDGYSKGVNRKLGRTGLYPSYKVKEKIETVKYPTYPEADKLLSL